MADPTVCAILLTKDRPQMARQAVESFRRQTYDPIRRMLLIFDSGDPSWYDRRSDSENEVHIGADAHVGKTIGALRNMANECVDAAVLVHWDSDDLSHANRISEQVSLLQASGADCVGYRECIFWDTRFVDPQIGGEAWLYSNNDPRYAIGSSLAYWRRIWEQRPFPDQMRREDEEWRKGVNCVGVSSILQLYEGAMKRPMACGKPRMVCRIHGGNTAGYTEATLRGSVNWKRLPEWDERVRKVVEEA